MEVPTQGVMFCEESSNHPGFCPIKVQKPNPGTPTRFIAFDIQQYLKKTLTVNSGKMCFHAVMIHIG
jgi:hypothetical protein